MTGITILAITMSITGTSLYEVNEPTAVAIVLHGSHGQIQLAEAVFEREVKPLESVSDSLCSSDHGARGCVLPADNPPTPRASAD